MQQIIEIARSTKPDDKQYILADVINGLGIVVLPPPFEDMGKYQLFHVPTGWALGNAAKRIQVMRFRRAMLDTFKGVDWSKVSPDDMSELGCYQPAARHLVRKHTGEA